MAVLMAGQVVPAWSQAGTAGPAELSEATRRALLASLDKGVAYLKANQKPNGSWEFHEGITGLAAIAVLNQPGRAQNDTASENAIKFMVGLAKPDGSIYSKDMAAVNTAIVMMSLMAAKKPEHDAIVKKAQDYLVNAQFDDGEGFSRTSLQYGGIGYDDESRADLSNLHHVLEALKASSLPAESPVWDKAIQFIQRTQNHKATNDQSWTADDGGFVYMPGMSFAGGTKSYGSMTYAGLLSYTYSSVKKEDARVQKAYEWIRSNYSVDENPGLGDTTLYYYYMVFAKALDAIGEPIITDPRGTQHNWREDLGKKLVALQYPEGYWVNKNPDHWQDNKVLVTAFTAIAIEHVLGVK